MSDAEASHEERDAMIRAALAEHGDSGITPRHTLFYFFGDDEGLGDLNEVARRAGYLTRGSEDSLVLETTMAVDEASFAPVSAMMQSWAAAFQLDYDGWECAVVTN
ncbi:ribonuclease E inhibitor RraB [Brevundimonas sp.]|uniref:ribonuclease E inhibitor RraB n=1 Tax=Brevundimonas sp. TaxID=1871086 RepID=UPI0025C207EF|nr:ribonuclease E inhibitor RraB [Brevundimonas sp.]